MQERLAFEVFVEIDPGRITGVTGEGKSVCVIPFAGSAAGALFNGVVSPGGADVQTKDATGALRVSARYALAGTDYTGRACHIYIDNEGRFEDGVLPSPFHTTPRSSPTAPSWPGVSAGSDTAARAMPGRTALSYASSRRRNEYEK